MATFLKEKEMDWEYWLLILVLVAVVVVAIFARRVQLAMRLRKQLKECATYKEAGLIVDYAYMSGFAILRSEAKSKEQRLYTEFLRIRDEQFQKDLDNAVGSEEKLLALIKDGQYSEHIDPHFNSYVGRMVREQLRPFTEKRILEATSIEGLLSLTGEMRYLRNMYIGVRGGFNRVDEGLADLYLKKCGQLVCLEAIASKSSHDLCFKVKTGDNFVDAIVSIKKEIIVLTSQQDTPVYVGGLSTEVGAVLETALERM